ncbi:MAG: hypothetical protein WA952_12420 [Lewinella sp.]
MDLVREEEDYYAGEENNTRLMITRLRKIFYDAWGWNSELIRGARSIEARYMTTIVPDATQHSKPVRRYGKQGYEPKHRLITYRQDDRVYGDTRVGEVPPIYQSDHQEVRLPSGALCDLAHVLAGLDAFNYPQVVSPLPRFLQFAAKVFPHVDSNGDVVTWLGDIASSSGDFLFDRIRKNRDLSASDKQKIIERDAPGSDMLGNIDAFVVAHFFDTGTTGGERVSEILRKYYHGPGGPSPYRRKRIGVFCEAIGLKGWDGRNFSNEDRWMRYYRHHLRNNVAFQVFSLTDMKLDSIYLPLGVYFGRYNRELEMTHLLQIWLEALRTELMKENQVTP